MAILLKNGCGSGRLGAIAKVKPDAIWNLGRLS